MFGKNVVFVSISSYWELSHRNSFASQLFNALHCLIRRFQQRAQTLAMIKAQPTDLMAILVVNFLEMIQIEQQYGKRSTTHCPV